MRPVRASAAYVTMFLVIVGMVVAPAGAAPPEPQQPPETPAADIWEPEPFDEDEPGGPPPSEPWDPGVPDEATQQQRSARSSVQAPGPNQALGDSGSYTFHEFWMDGDEGAQAIKVNVGAGNLFIRAQMSELAGPGVPASASRVYNSQFDSTRTNMANWVEDFTILGLFVEGEVLRYYDGTGAQWVFSRSGNSWEAPAGLNAELSRAQDGTWRLVYNKTGEQVSFNPSGWPAGRMDRNGVGVTYGYNSDRVTSITDATGKTINLDYYPAGTGHILDTVRAAGRSTDFSYEHASNGSPMRLTVANENGIGRPTWTMRYDNIMRLTQMSGAGRSISFTYDSSNRVTKVTQSRSGESNVVTQFAYTSTGTTVTDPRGNTVKYDIDDQWRVTKTTDQLDRERSQTWTANSDVETLTDAFGTGGEAGNVTETTYDTLNNQTSITMPTGAAVQARYTAGPDCPAAQSGNPYLVKCTISAQGNTASMTYDAAGNLTEQRDTTPNGVAATHRYTYEGQNGSVCGGHPGQICTATDPRGKVTTYSYTKGMVSRITPPAPLGATSYTYDTVGRVTSVTDGNGDTTRYAYDAADRITRTTYDNGQTLTSTYNPDGTLASQTDSASGVTISNTYNLLGNTTTEKVTYPGAAFPYPTVGATVAMAYDAAGNLTSTNETGELHHYVYDAANQLARTYPDSGSCTTSGKSAAASGCVKFTYDKNGAETSRAFPGGARQDTTRDASGRAIRITAVDRSGAKKSDIGYSYARGGADSVVVQKRTSHLEQGIPAGASTAYAYDSLDRLTSATETAGGRTNASWKYVYDAANNRTSQTRSGTTGHTAGTITYAYNAANQITSTSADTSTWAYDRAGNQTRNGITGETTSYGDRLQVTGRNGTSVGNFGDGNAHRLAAGTTQYLTTDRGVAQRTAPFASRSVSYHRGADGDVLGYTTGGATRYLTADHQGSTVGVFADDGTWLGGYSYSPYGEARYSAPEADIPRNHMRYIGQLEDGGGTYKLGARYYDSSLGRFTQMDPAGQDSNPYGYASCNPVNQVDPTGLRNCLPLGIAAAVHGFTWSAAITATGVGAPVGLSITAGVAVFWLVASSLC